ncbi:MAG: GNAT family N-acetyltransferase [Candidatus Rokuibacteriota bacterium]
MGEPIRFRPLPGPRDPAWRSFMTVYAGAFDAGELESEAGIVRNMSTPQAPRDDGHVVVVAETPDGECAGGIIFSYLPAVHCGYASYLCVAPPWRERGIARALLTEMRRGLAAAARARRWPAPRGLFTEIKRETAERADSYARLAFWRHQGVRPLAVDWKYPALHEHAGPLPAYLAFGSYGDAVDWYPADVEAVAGAIFGATYSYLPTAAATLGLIADGLRRLPDRPIPYIIPAAPP